MTHFFDIAYLLRSGVIGWQADARGDYSAYVQGHNLQQLLIQVNSKNYKPKPAPQFQELFPEHQRLHMLDKKKEVDLDSKLESVLGMLGAANGADSSGPGGGEGR